MYGNFYDRLFIKHFSIEKICIYVISIITAIITFIIFFNATDRIPATEDDFEELHEWLLQVQNKPEEFMNHKGTINIYENKILYEIENDQCLMKGTYNKEYELIEYTRKDKMLSTFAAIFICGLIGILAAVLMAFILILLICLIGSIVIGIIIIVKKVKRFKANKNEIKAD